ncbi:MAG: sensor histidine kinase [Thermoanaerobaculia bacterium]
MSERDSRLGARLLPETSGDLGRTIALGAAYFAAGKLGLALAVVHPNATAVWAPTGIALAAFLTVGLQAWPGVFVAAFLVNLTTAGTFATSIGIATGNTLEALVGAIMIRRLAGGRDAFDRAIDVFWFLLLGGVLATTLSPTVGLASLALGGFARWSDSARIWVTWWLGDAAGAIVVAPALILWANDHRVRGNPKKAVEAASLSFGFAFLCFLLFARRAGPAVNHVPIQFFCIPLLLWAAFRFGARETATLLVILSGIAAWGTAGGVGPFASLDPTRSLLILQAFMAVISVTMLVVAALVAERGRAAQARDEILSIAGHELRTPLSTLTLQVENLSRGLRLGAPAEVLAARLESVRRSGSRLSALVDEMLNVSRVTSGVMPLKLERVDLSAFAKEATTRFLEELSNADCRASVVAPEPVWCRTDRERLGYVFNNLLSNAVKYGLSKPVEITVSRREAIARISVRDQGLGIARSDQKRIFQRFERAASASRAGGFGLGLWIARKNVEALGGRIAVVSDPGAGSTFSVELPTEEPRTPAGSIRPDLVEG